MIRTLETLLSSQDVTERYFAEWLLDIAGALDDASPGASEAYRDAEETWEECVAHCLLSTEANDDVRRAEELAMRLIRVVVANRRALLRRGWVRHDDGTLSP